MTQFNALGLAEPILRAIQAEGYTDATPIQSQVIPAMMRDRDILGIAQTGTGKTASFVLPLLHKINEQRRKPRPKSCGALILTPTRELATQIAANIKAYGAFMRPTVAVIVGGMSPKPQVRAVAGGVDILVATPGRLLDHMGAGAIMLNFTDTLVLDEADQMLDLGFVPAIRKIVGRLPADRQTVLMSATMPKQIRALAKDFQDNPEEISVAAVSRPIERIDQSVIFVERPNKAQVLADILSAPEAKRTIVFTRTKRGADKINVRLQKLGFASAAIHGNKSQGQRDKALDAFRAGSCKILVATDVAARGIDIDDVTHVVNFELPNVPEAYVHRIGRTARAGRTGVAISLCDTEEHEYLIDIEQLTGNTIECKSGTRPEYTPPQKKPKKAKKRKGQKATEASVQSAPTDHGAGNKSKQQKRTPQPANMKNERPQNAKAKQKPAKNAVKAQQAPRSQKTPSGKTTGMVKWFNSHKGYGFIAPSDGSPDIFLHLNDVKAAGIKPPKEGDKLGYDVAADRPNGKTTAVNLRAA